MRNERNRSQPSQEGRPKRSKPTMPEQADARYSNDVVSNTGFLARLTDKNV